MRIRPGRERSLAAGVGVLLVTFLGCAMFGTFGSFAWGMGGVGPGMSFGPMGLFGIIWVVFGLVGAGVAFYNAFSDRGVALYEIEMDEADSGAFCPQCGKRIAEDSQFCRHCGAPMK